MTITRATIPMCPKCGAELSNSPTPMGRAGKYYQCSCGELVSPDRRHWGYHGSDELERVKAVAIELSNGLAELHASLEAITKEIRLIPASTPGLIKIRQKLLELTEGMGD